MQNNQLATKSLFERDDVKKRFQEMLGKRAASFITSVLQIVSQNSLLVNADPTSIYQAAAVAATLDLPLNNNLGFAYIVPYNDRQKGQVAQFQMGYKGFIQLAQRSGQFKSLGSCPILEGQVVEANPLDGYKFDFTKKTSDIVIGYAAKFTLINGFEATYYMSIEQLRKHGSQYSQSFKKGFGLWKDNFDAMANKTVLKLLLSKFAPLSVDMQKAVITDQSVINDADTLDVDYIDNEALQIDVSENQQLKENQRIHDFIENCTDLEMLDKEENNIPDALKKMFKAKQSELLKK